jgi:hypothetical protein
MQDVQLVVKLYYIMLHYWQFAVHLKKSNLKKIVNLQIEEVSFYIEILSFVEILN